jgi:hypothetical protein
LSCWRSDYDLQAANLLLTGERVDVCLGAAHDVRLKAKRDVDDFHRP